MAQVLLQNRRKICDRHGKFDFALGWAVVGWAAPQRTRMRLWWLRSRPRQSCAVPPPFETGSVLNTYIVLPPPFKGGPIRGRLSSLRQCVKH